MDKKDFAALVDLDQPLPAEKVKEYLLRMVRFETITQKEAVQFLDTLPTLAHRMRATVVASSWSKIS
jgi:hypothetical protein